MSAPAIPPTAWNDQPVICLRQSHPPPLRVAMIVIGLTIMVGVVAELGRGLWPPSLATLFFGVIVAGGLSVGGTLALAGIVGDDVTWTLGEDALCLDLRSPWRRRSCCVRADDIAEMVVRTQTWDSGPDTYALRLRLHDGLTVDTPPLPSRQAAEALAEELRRRLALAGA